MNIKKIGLMSVWGIFLLFAYCSCQKILHVNELPFVNTGDTSNRKATSVTVTGDVILNDAPITAGGHVWSASSSAPTYGSSEGRSRFRTLFPHNKIISVLTGLFPGKTYAIRGYVISGADTIYGNVIHFSTLDTALFTVTTGQPSHVTSVTAEVSATLNLASGAGVSQHGHVWSSKDSIPILSDSLSKLGPSQQSTDFSSALTNLVPGTLYYARAYAMDNSDTIYGQVVSFTTTSSIVPSVVTGAVGSITANGAAALGNVTAIGSTPISQYGHVWSSSNSLPTINDSKSQLGSLSAPASFTSTLTGLSPGTTYFVRAYAVNASGISYGAAASFQTTVSGTNIPTVVTGALGAVRFDGVDAQGNITDVGSSPVTDHGFVFSDYSALPTTGIPSPGAAVFDLGSKTGPGAYAAAVAKLQPGTHYWMRAFATNSNGTAYGDTVSFVTRITIITSPIYQITSTYAQLWGVICSGPSLLGLVFKYGFVYSTNSVPTINDSKTEAGPAAANDNLSFGAQITGLTSGTKYYIRSYGINADGVEYGDVVSFTAGTAPASYLPAVGQSSTTYVGVDFIDMSGTILSVGSAALTNYGYVWSATNKLPTINDSKIDLGSSASVSGFSAIIKGLKGGTTYYVRPYATSPVGTTYGILTPYTTIDYTKPYVSTGVPALQGANVNCPGKIDDAGNTPVTQHGHVWSTVNQNPTLLDNFNQLGAALAGSYTSSLGTDVIKSGTVYYIRAYATNSGGTTYGDVKTFSY